MLLIDTSHLLYRIVYANKNEILTNPTFVSHLILNNVLSSMRQFAASKENPVVLALDSRPYWRTDIYAKGKVKFEEYNNEKFEKYKGQRKKDESIPWDEIYLIYNEVLKSLRESSDLFIVEAPTAEADDIIAVCANHCSQILNQDCYIVSSDKDFKQLHIPPRVTVYDPMKKVFLPTLDIEEQKKLHALCGDGGDNIQSIMSPKRFGPAGAKKIIDDFDHFMAIYPDKKERYEFNRSLTDFDRIPKKIVDSILENLKSQGFNYNAINLLKLFSKMRLAKIGERISEFKLCDSKPQNELNKSFKTVEKNRQMFDNTLENFFN